MVSAASGKGPVQGLQEWIDGGMRTSLEDEKFAKKTLRADEADQAARIIWEHRRAEIARESGAQWEDRKFVAGKYEMPFDYKVFGDAPEDGRSLWISMHGGGNTTSDVNDGQWRNQMRLYTPQEGIYFVPRAAVDDWNMWFQPHIDTLFYDIIRTAVATQGVNPDKVYLMGYSAGGDGVYRMAPRMADSWAAASMMAGHPGDASPLNLRNTPFMLWMGGDDAAYDRNSHAEIYGRKLDRLQEKDPKGYIHEVHILEGMGHWMLRADTLAVPWMEQFARDPYPEKIVWQQMDVPHDSFYWVRVPHGLAQGREVIVAREGNKFIILQNDYEQLTIYMNDEMIDFAKPVEVWYEGKRIFGGKVRRNIRDIYETTMLRSDPRLVFSGSVTISRNSEGRSGK